MDVAEKEMTALEIQEVNDYLRKVLCYNALYGLICNFVYKAVGEKTIRGQLFVTQSVDALENDQKKELLEAVMNFSDFKYDNDPYEEHDFIVVKMFGETWYGKFDYYSKDLASFGHEFHVFTILNSSEY